MDRRCFDDESATLTVQAYGDSMVHTTRISATKSAPRQIDHLALTIEIHSNWSRSGTHLSTWINSSSMMTREHATLGLLRFNRPCDARLYKKIRAPMDRPSRSHHRNSRLESLRDPPIHINKRDFDDESPALTAQAPGNWSVRTMPVSTTKSAPRQIVRLVLTIEIHSDPSRSEADLSTWIEGTSMMTRRRSPFRLTAIRRSTRRASRRQNPRLDGSSALRSPSKFTAIRVAPGLTYPHG